MIKDALAQAQVFRRDLKQLVVREKLKALLKAHLLGRDEAQRFVGAGGACVGQVLGAAHVDRHVVGLRAHADDHARVDLGARRDEHLAALLRVPNAVGHGLAGLKRDEGAGIAAGDVALINVVLLKYGGEDAFALGVGKELVAVAEQAARRNEKFHLNAVADRRHLKELALAGAELLHDRTHGVLRHVDDDALDRLALLAVDLLIQHARGAWSR